MWGLGEEEEEVRDMKLPKAYWELTPSLPLNPVGSKSPGQLIVTGWAMEPSCLLIEVPKVTWQKVWLLGRGRTQCSLPFVHHVDPGAAETLAGA